MELGLVVFFPPLLTLLGVRLAFTEAFLELLYKGVNLPPDPMPYELRLSVAKLGLRSVLSEEGMREFKNSGLFNYREVKHMEDVKNLLKVSFGLLYVGLPAWLLGLAVLKDLRRVGRVLFLGGLLLELLVVLVIFLSLTSYQWLFEAFHNLFFDPYSWRFREEDMLLRVYPMDLWYKATLYTALMVFVFGAVFQAVGFLLWKSGAKSVEGTHPR